MYAILNVTLTLHPSSYSSQEKDQHRKPKLVQMQRFTDDGVPSTSTHIYIITSMHKVQWAPEKTRWKGYESLKIRISAVRLHMVEFMTNLHPWCPNNMDAYTWPSKRIDNISLVHLGIAMKSSSSSLWKKKKKSSCQTSAGRVNNIEGKMEIYSLLAWITTFQDDLPWVIIWLDNNWPIISVILQI